MLNVVEDIAAMKVMYAATEYGARMEPCGTSEVAFVLFVLIAPSKDSLATAAQKIFQPQKKIREEVRGQRLEKTFMRKAIKCFAKIYGQQGNPLPVAAVK